MKKTLLLCSFFLLFSCAKKEKDDIIATSDSNSGNKAIQVSDKDGGPGFEKLAESLGYTTKACTNFTDSNAKQGGTYKDSLGEFPGTLRVIGVGTNNTVTSTALSSLYLTLLSYSVYDNSYCPSLATHWKFIPGDNGDVYKEMDFRLDPNARWSDGKPITADDYIATWNLEKDEGIQSPIENKEANKITLTKISDYLLKMEISNEEIRKSWISLQYLPLFTPLPSSYISTVDGADYLTKYDKEVLPSSGPYEIKPENIKQDEYIMKTRVKDWWGNDYPMYKNLFNYDAIRYDIITDQNLIKERFKKGELDVFTPKPEEWYNEFNSSFDPINRNLMLKKIVFYRAGRATRQLHFNITQKPFDDIKVRQAVAHLLKRDNVNKLFVDGAVTVDSWFPLSPNQNPTNETYKYDPDLANKLLDDAGYTQRDADGIRKNANGERLEFDVYMWKVDLFQRMLALFQQDLKEGGIKINLITLEFSEVTKKIDNKDFKMQFMGWSSTVFPNPRDEIHSSLADQKGTNNISGIKNPNIDALIQKYEVALDPKERIAALQGIDLEYNKNVYGIFLYVSPYSARFIHWRYIKTLPDSVVGFQGQSNGWWIDQDEKDKVDKALSDKSITFPKEKIMYDKWNFNTIGYKPLNGEE